MPLSTNKRYVCKIISRKSTVREEIVTLKYSLHLEYSGIYVSSHRLMHVTFHTASDVSKHIFAQLRYNTLAYQEHIQCVATSFGQRCNKFRYYGAKGLHKHILHPSQNRL